MADGTGAATTTIGAGAGAVRTEDVAGITTGTDGEVEVLETGTIAATAVARGTNGERKINKESASLTTVLPAGTRIGAIWVGAIGVGTVAGAGTEAAAIDAEELREVAVDAISVAPETGAIVIDEVAEGKTLTAVTIEAATGSEAGKDAPMVTVGTRVFLISGRSIKSSTDTVLAGSDNKSSLLTVLDCVVRVTGNSSIVAANLTDSIGDLLALATVVEAAFGMTLDGLPSTLEETAVSLTGNCTDFLSFSFDVAIAVAAIEAAVTAGTSNAASVNS